MSVSAMLGAEQFLDRTVQLVAGTFVEHGGPPGVARGARRRARATVGGGRRVAAPGAPVLDGVGGTLRPGCDSEASGGRRGTSATRAEA